MTAGPFRLVDRPAREREEEGLLRLRYIKADIHTRMETWLWNHVHNPTQTSPTQPAAEAQADRTRLLNMWHTELSWKIRDEAVPRRVVDLLNELSDVSAGGSTNQTELQGVVDAGSAITEAIRRVLKRS